MKTVEFMLTSIPILSREDEANLLDKYNHDTPRAIKDLVEWQRDRYSNMIKPIDLCNMLPYTIIKSIILMLYERGKYGYPYEPYEKIKESNIKIPIWVVPSKKPYYARGL